MVRTPRHHRFAVSVALATHLIVSLAPLFAQGPPPPPPIPPLPPLQVPVGNAITVAKTNLGKALFWDEQLSSTRTVACGTCHQPHEGGSDPRSIIGSAASLHPGPDLVFGNADDIVGSPGVPLNGADGFYQWEASFGLRPQVTGRKAPSAINAAFSVELFWDGRAGQVLTDPITGSVVLASNAALETQVLAPPISTAEMGHIGRDWANVAADVAAAVPLELSPSVPAALATWIAGRSYPELFQEAFGTPQVTPARIAMAIATYERVLISNQTPFDAAIAGNPNALTQQERAGQAVFAAKNCGACHGGPLLSDDRFHYIGVRPVNEDLGRFTVTAAPGDRGAFRTPSLRNVDLRGPYMHNGRLATLEDVVDFYNRGGDFTAPNKAPQIVPLNLTAQERTDLLAFLRRPLTDPRVANRTAPFDPPTLYAGSARMPATAIAAGSAGQGGIVPVATAIEPPLAGNPNFTLAVTRARGAATAILVIDSTDPGADPNIPGSPAFARVQIQLQGTGAGNGYGSTNLVVPNTPSVVGRQFFGRWFVLDAAAAGGVAASPAFSLTVFGTAVAPVVQFHGFAVR